VVTVSFNETYAEEHGKLKFYQEIVTFYGKAGENTAIEVTIRDPSLTTDLFHPFTYINRRSIVSLHGLDLSVDLPPQVIGKELNITVFKHHTGEFVDALFTKSSDNVTLDLEQGLYDITILCEDCRITKVLNISVNGDRGLEIVVPFGEEPDFDDETDTSGLLICLIPSFILILLAIMGAYFAFTKKKFFLSVLGAIAVIPQQSVMLAIPALNCISVNMILGIIAAVLIFRARTQFLDAMPPQQQIEQQPPPIEPRYEEVEERASKKKTGKGKKKGKKA